MKLFFPIFGFFMIGCITLPVDHSDQYEFPTHFISLQKLTIQRKNLSQNLLVQIQNNAFKKHLKIILLDPIFQSLVGTIELNNGHIKISEQFNGKKKEIEQIATLIYQIHQSQKKWSLTEKNEFHHWSIQLQEIEEHGLCNLPKNILLEYPTLSLIVKVENLNFTCLDPVSPL